MARLAVLGVATVMALLASACQSEDADDPPAGDTGMRVASFDFAESVLLAEMYAQVIESTGVPVVRLGPIGPREVVAPALEQALIDVVPEYLGTALRHAGSPESESDVGAAQAQLTELLAPRGLTVLTPAAAADTNVIAVTAETAERSGLRTISDLAPIASELSIGGPPECPDRPLCLVGFEAEYGLQFREFVQQRSQKFTAEALRRGEIDVGVMFSTDAALVTFDLVVLDDDRGLQPAENIVPVIRTAALERWGPAVAESLNALSAELTTVDLRILNARVDRDESVERVAYEWLSGRHLLSG